MNARSRRGSDDVRLTCGSHRRLRDVAPLRGLRNDDKTQMPHLRFTPQATRCRPAPRAPKRRQNTNATPAVHTAGYVMSPRSAGSETTTTQHKCQTCGSQRRLRDVAPLRGLRNDGGATQMPAIRNLTCGSHRRLRDVAPLRGLRNDDDGGATQTWAVRERCPKLPVRCNRLQSSTHKAPARKMPYNRHVGRQTLWEARERSMGHCLAVAFHCLKGCHHLGDLGVSGLGVLLGS